MRRFENVFVGVVAVVCALYLYFSLQMSMGALSRPGPGFVPTVFGTIGLISSIVILAGNLRKDRASAAAAKTVVPDARTDAAATDAAVLADTSATSIGLSVAIAEAEASGVGMPAAGTAGAIADIAGIDAASADAAVKTSIKAEVEARKEAARNNAVDREGMLRFLGYLAASILFIPMLRYLGALLTVFILVLALNKVSGAKGWVKPFLFAAICSGAFYVVFELALHVSLPRGIL